MMRRRAILVLLTGLSLLVMSPVGLAGDVDLVILHTNDIHGRIEIEDGQLGLPYVGALVDYYQAEYEHVLVLDAGDAIHGKPVTNTLEGESAVMAMNAAGYDVMVSGNHDFNFGYDRLLELKEEYMEFDLVAGNVFKEGELLFDPYVIKDFGVYKVGIFGLATPDTCVTTHPHNIEGIEFGAMVETADEYITVLREEYNVDLVVALGHVGIGASREVAAAVEGIDLFVDAHSHSRLPEGEWEGDTLIVQAHEYTKYLGVVEVDLSGDVPAMQASLISAQVGRDLVEPDEQIIEMLEQFREEMYRIMLGD
ncbi:MAG: bifunctional UDP-sugar hydrolase/5'-nucleotidase [Candidatus Bipolaricaulota bacterium]